jgi:hypothetical protein
MGTLGAKTSQWRPLQVAPRTRALLAIPEIRHCISQRTRMPKSATHIAQRTPFMRCGNISYSNWSLLSTNIIIKMRLFGICVLRGEHMSDFLHFLFRAYLVVWVLLLHCLTNTIMSHMCLLRILSFLYAFGI